MLRLFAQPCTKCQAGMMVLGLIFAGQHLYLPLQLMEVKGRSCMTELAVSPPETSYICRSSMKRVRCAGLTDISTALNQTMLACCRSAARPCWRGDSLQSALAANAQHHGHQDSASHYQLSDRDKGYFHPFSTYFSASHYSCISELKQQKTKNKHGLAPRQAPPCRSADGQHLDEGAVKAHSLKAP